MAGTLYPLIPSEPARSLGKESWRSQCRHDDCEHRFCAFPREESTQLRSNRSIRKHESAETSMAVRVWNRAPRIDEELRSTGGFPGRRGERCTEIDGTAYNTDDDAGILSSRYPENGQPSARSHAWNRASCVDEKLRSRGGFLIPSNDSGEECSGVSRVTQIDDDACIMASPYPENGGVHKPDDRTIHLECDVSYVAKLRTCTKNRNLKEGIRIHDIVLKRGLLEHCTDALVTMYAKCGALAEAEDLLSTHNSRDVYAWTALISVYAQKGFSQDALKCYKKMQKEGLFPDEVTFSCVLKACGSVGALDIGRQIHDEISKRALLQKNIVLGTALVDMYAKCGALMKAQCVLEELPSRTAICWNALITGYTQHGQGEQALNCFECMLDEGLSPSTVTFTCILSVCGSLGNINMGTQIHDEIVKKGLLTTDIALGNALIDMYVKCGFLTKARSLLEELPFRNVITWSSLIAGYTQHGQAEHALNCFELMLDEGLSPNDVTFSCILKACGMLGSISKGREIHDEILHQGLLRNNIVLGNAVLDMYVKCGELAEAEQVLEGLTCRDVCSWNTLIAGYAQQGQGMQALTCFERMQHDGILPDIVTFACVLNACNHLGLVDEGYNHFVNMSANYGLKPDLDIYICMIDLLGRAGNLDKVVELVQGMPSKNSTVWHAVLGACRKWGDVNVGMWAFEHAVQIDRSDGAAYILMANTYVAAGMQDNAKDIEAMRIDNKAWKKPSYSLWSGASRAFDSALVGGDEGMQRMCNF